MYRRIPIELLLLHILSIPVTSEVTSHNYFFCIADDSLKANYRPARLLPNLTNVQDKLVVSSSQHTSRKERHLYHPDSNPSLGIGDIANDPINTPFPFFPPVATFGFPSFWQPVSGTGNYRLLVSRVARLEEEIGRLNQKMVLIDGLLRCVNITYSPSCAGLHPASVSASTHVPTPPGGFVPFVSGQSATGGASGVVVSSSYSRPAGSEGHGTMTVQHFGDRPQV